MLTNWILCYLCHRFGSKQWLKYSRWSRSLVCKTNLVCISLGHMIWSKVLLLCLCSDLKVSYWFLFTILFPIRWESLGTHILSLLLYQILLLVKYVRCRHLLVLCHSHQGCRLVLFPHHLDSFLSTIKVELIILLPLLHLVRYALSFLYSIRCGPIFSILGTHLTSFALCSSTLHSRKLKLIFFRWALWMKSSQVFWSWLIESTIRVLNVFIDISNTVLHENKMCILVWALNCLPLLDPLV